MRLSSSPRMIPIRAGGAFLSLGLAAFKVTSTPAMICLSVRPSVGFVAAPAPRIPPTTTSPASDINLLILTSDVQPPSKQNGWLGLTKCVRNLRPPCSLEHLYFRCSVRVGLERSCNYEAGQ